jgi:hypothetical protein
MELVKLNTKLKMELEGTVRELGVLRKRMDNNGYLYGNMVQNGIDK